MRHVEARFPDPPTRAPDVSDDFSSPTLRADLWVPDYLPHWTTPERSRARFELGAASGIRLLIEHDQPDWRPEDAPCSVPRPRGASTSPSRQASTRAVAPQYPMLLMVDLFETEGRSATPRAYPKSASVLSVRGWTGPL